MNNSSIVIKILAIVGYFLIILLLFSLLLYFAIWNLLKYFPPLDDLVTEALTRGNELVKQVGEQTGKTDELVELLSQFAVLCKRPRSKTMPYRKIMQFLLLSIITVFTINLVIDLIRQYKYYTSEQYLIDAAHSNLEPITVHTIHIRSAPQPPPNLNPNSTPNSSPNFDSNSGTNSGFTSEPPESLIIDIKKSMQNKNRHEGTILNASYNLSVPRKFVFRYKKTIEKLFDLMLDNRPELEKLCSDGIHRLEDYITFGYGLNSLIQVAGIIKGFDKLLDNIRPGRWCLNLSDKKNWFRFAVILIRLLTMYQFIGNDVIIKTTCGKLVNKMTAKPDQVLGWNLLGPERVFVAVPRLLNLLYCEDPNFQEKVKSESFKELGRELEGEGEQESGGKDDLMMFEGFYKNLYSTLRIIFLGILGGQRQ